MHDIQITQTRTLVLNQSYEPVGTIPVEDAFCLTYQGKADLVESYPTPLHSTHDEWERPAVIRIKSRVKYNPHHPVELSRKNVLRRDNYTCAYCGVKSKTLTVDHVIPKSRGGGNTWDNLVAACNSCNNQKDNFLPEEIGMELSFKPRKPSRLLFMFKHFQNSEQWAPYLFIGKD